MKLPPLLLALSALCAIPASAAGPEPLSIIGFTERDTAIYVAGITAGLRGANSYIEALGGHPFLCQPGPYNINGRELWRLAADNLDGPQEAQTVATAMAYELASKHRCEQ